MPIKYENIPTIAIAQNNHILTPRQLPEVVHVEDPALDVMIDFKQVQPATTVAEESIDNALNEMKLSGAHLMLVTDSNSRLLGLVSTEDILGQKPIKLIQQRQLKRANIQVKLVMTPLSQITAIDIASLTHTKVGHIINTMKHLSLHYLLVIRQQEQQQLIRGLFSSSQISRQLHTDINDSVTEAHSIAELQKRHS